MAGTQGVVLIALLSGGLLGFIKFGKGLVGLFRAVSGWFSN